MERTTTFIYFFNVSLYKNCGINFLSATNLELLSNLAEVQPSFTVGLRIKFYFFCKESV